MGAAMGWTARQVDDLSLWEFLAAVDGYAEANGVGRVAAPTDEEFDRAVEADLRRG